MKFLETGYFFSSNAVVSTTWSLVSMIAVRASSAVAAPNARFSRPSTASRPLRTSGEALYAINFWSTLLNFLTRRSSAWKRKRTFISYSNCVTSSLQWLTVPIQFSFKKNCDLAHFPRKYQTCSWMSAFTGRSNLCKLSLSELMIWCRLQEAAPFELVTPSSIGLWLSLFVAFFKGGISSNGHLTGDDDDKSRPSELTCLEASSMSESALQSSSSGAWGRARAAATSFADTCSTFKKINASVGRTRVASVPPTCETPIFMIKL